LPRLRLYSHAHLLVHFAQQFAFQLSNTTTDYVLDVVSLHWNSKQQVFQFHSHAASESLLTPEERTTVKKLSKATFNV
jgi:hypothetical protein